DILDNKVLDQIYDLSHDPGNTANAQQIAGSAAAAIVAGKGVAPGPAAVSSPYGVHETQEQVHDIYSDAKELVHDIYSDAKELAHEIHDEIVNVFSEPSNSATTSVHEYAQEYPSSENNNQEIFDAGVLAGMAVSVIPVMPYLFESLSTMNTIETNSPAPIHEIEHIEISASSQTPSIFDVD
ncbi:MAG: hypothetical protein ABL863_03040, partial [Nitrosomonas sp.]